MEDQDLLTLVETVVRAAAVAAKEAVAAHRGQAALEYSLHSLATLDFTDTVTQAEQILHLLRILEAAVAAPVLPEDLAAKLDEMLVALEEHHL